MKTFFEILEEAAVEAGDISLSSAIKLNLDDEHLELLTKAADIYTSQSNSHKPVVMQAEGSDSAHEAAVGNGAAGKGVSEDCNCMMPMPDMMQICFKCNKKINYNRA